MISKVPKLFALILVIGLANSCASYPQTGKEFQSFDGLSKMDFPVTAKSLNEASERLMEYGKSCLNFSQQSAMHGGSGPTTRVHRSVNVYRTSIEKTSHETVLYLQEEDSDKNPFLNEPKGGFFTMMIKVAQKDKKIEGQIIYYDSFIASHYRVIRDAAIKWVGKNERKCVE